LTYPDANRNMLLKYFRFGKIDSGLLALVIGLSVVAFSQSPPIAQNARISGVLKNSAGHPVEGALVKLTNKDLGVGFMVVTKAEGRYSTPNIPSGRYTVQAFAGDSQSAPGTSVEARHGEQGKADLVLSLPLSVPPPLKRLNEFQYADLMPPGEGKDVLTVLCTSCHSFLWIVSARKTPGKWAETVDRMRDDLQGRERPLNDLVKETEFDAIKKYLSKNYSPGTPIDPRVAEQMFAYPGGPSHANRNLPGKLLTGAAAKYVAMEFSVPSGSVPDGIAVDSKGTVWVSESKSGMIGRFDPGSLAYTRIAVPPGKTPKIRLNSIAIDPQDHVWCVDDGPNGRILQYNPQTRGFDAYPMPDFPYPVPDDSGPYRMNALGFLDGNVWGTALTANWILKLDPSTRKTTVYPIPKGTSPFGLAIGGDKMIWYDAEVNNRVIKLDPVSSRIVQYEVFTAKSDLRLMAADAEGNLWVAADESNKLLKVDYRDGHITEYTPPTEAAGPYSVDVDKQRNQVWFSEIFSDKIGRFDPRTNSFVEFPAPSANLDLRRVAVDRTRLGRVWWAGAQADKIGYIEVME